MKKEYRITVSQEGNTKWTFRFQGRLTWWQQMFAKLAGFKVEQIKE